MFDEYQAKRSWTMKQSLEFSLIVPVYNEEEVLPKLFEVLSASLGTWVHGDWEVILVDDGSRDKTAILIVGQNRIDPRFKLVKLSRNFGHQPAVATGLAYAGGRYVGVVDADLQDPIEILRRLYEGCSSGEFNVTYGVRQKREVPLLLDVCYKSFYRFMGRFSDHPWPVDAGDFCVIDRLALDNLLALPESTRILRGLRSWIGLRQLAIPYERPRRTAGTSKYNFFRLTRLAIDSVVGFSSIPLQVAVWFGLSMSAFCAFVMVLFFLNRVFPEFTLFGYSIGASPGIATTVILLTLVSAINFFCLGIIGQYLGLVLKEVKRRPQAIVQQIVGDVRRRHVAFPLSGDGGTESNR
jgi:polyisoprenyl-phosphate glycosyltransferase